MYDQDDDMYRAVIKLVVEMNIQKRTLEIFSIF